MMNFEAIIWDLVMRGAGIKIGKLYIEIDNDGIEWVLSHQGSYVFKAASFQEIYEYLEENKLI